MNLSCLAQSFALSLALLSGMGISKGHSTEIPPTDQPPSDRRASTIQENQSLSVENLTPLETLELADREVDALIARIESLDLDGEFLQDLASLKEYYDLEIEDENDSFGSIIEEIDREQQQKIQELQEPIPDDYEKKLAEINQETTLCKQRVAEIHAMTLQDCKARYKRDKESNRKMTELQKLYFQNALLEAHKKKQQIQEMYPIINRE